MPFDNRVMNIAARKHVGEFVANEFADAELALRAAQRLIAMLVTCHFAKSQLVFVIPGLNRQ